MRRTSTQLLALGLAATLLTGCQTSSSDPFGHERDGKDQTVKPADRPPMETMLARYRAFQADLLRGLDKAYGKKPWKEDPDLGFDRSGCSHDELPDGEEVSPGDVGFQGSYAVESWKAVREFVMGVGKAHGFSHVTTLVDKPGEYLFFIGRDRYGAEYTFGMGVNTTFGIRTGCHRWNATPTPPPYTPPTAF